MNSNTGADEQVVIRKRETTLINLINICTEAGGKLLEASSRCLQRAAAAHTNVIIKLPFMHRNIWHTL